MIIVERIESCPLLWKNKKTAHPSFRIRGQETKPCFYFLYIMVNNLKQFGVTQWCGLDTPLSDITLWWDCVLTNRISWLGLTDFIWRGWFRLAVKCVCIHARWPPCLSCTRLVRHLCTSLENVCDACSSINVHLRGGSAPHDTGCVWNRRSLPCCLTAVIDRCLMRQDFQLEALQRTLVSKEVLGSHLW